jgi:hypothetical protein
MLTSRRIIRFVQEIPKISRPIKIDAWLEPSLAGGHQSNSLSLTLAAPGQQFPDGILDNGRGRLSS